MSLVEYLSRKLVRLTTKLIMRSAGNPFITFGEIALKKGTCCICGGKLYDLSVNEGHFSSIQIFKKATWDNGPFATVTTRDGYAHHNFAVAIVCAECEKLYGDLNGLQSSVKFAVELDLRRKDIVYHDVKELEDYPIIIER